jgi:hypothetical protein
MQDSRRTDPRADVSAERGTIELRVSDLSQLLQRNPPPLGDGSLTAEAENYILRKAKRLPAHQPIRLLIDVPPDAANPDALSDVAAAITGHFQVRADEESQDVRELFRYGRKALMIGFVTLSTCLFLAWYSSDNLPTRPITRLMEESFIILGWVSMWRPIEIFLYDWLPLDRRRKLCLRLADAKVMVESELPHQL